MFPHLVGRNWHFFSLVWVSGTVSSNPVGWFFPQPLILSSHTCMIQYYTYAKYSRVSSAAFRVLSLSSLLLSGIMFGELELPWFTWTFSSSPHNPVSPSRSPLPVHWPGNSFKAVSWGNYRARLSCISLGSLWFAATCPMSWRFLFYTSHSFLTTSKGTVNQVSRTPVGWEENRKKIFFLTFGFMFVIFCVFSMYLFLWLNLFGLKKRNHLSF